MNLSAVLKLDFFQRRPVDFRRFFLPGEEDDYRFFGDAQHPAIDRPRFIPREELIRILLLSKNLTETC
jgi:hypothetical protein